MTSPSRVVVLGERGFVAGALIRLLAREGIACRPVGRREADLTAGASVETLRSILRSDDSVVMTSALTPEHGRDRATYERNVAMAGHLRAALEVTGCAHLVYVSSDSVYDPTVTVVDERTRCDPADFYGQAHLARERLLPDACIVRPSAIYGTGDTHNSYGPNRFLRSALAEGRIVLFGDGEEERDHVAAGDVARILVLCLRRRTRGVLNAVSGQAISFRRCAETIRDALERPVEILSAPRMVEIRHRRFDTAALRRTLPDFEPAPFAQGIREMIEEHSWTTNSI